MCSEVLVRSLTKCCNFYDFRQAAQSYLPAPLFHFIDGGADDECTKNKNTAAFDKVELIPRCLRDVRTVNTRTSLFGRDIDLPVILAPTGMTKLFHPGGEAVVAREAEKAGVGYTLSTMGNTSLEDISRIQSGLKLFQLYLLADDKLNYQIIDRCRHAGYDALCLTVDAVVPGNRERDIRSGMTMPPRLTLRSFLDFARRPQWCARYLAGEALSLPNCRSELEGGEKLSSSALRHASIMETNLSWERVETLISYWGKPFVLKGIMSVEDAIKAAEVGASSIVISNHGGRQLDGAPGTLEMLPEIADAVGGKIKIILDGGIRRGSHVVKALAMGADACMIGRPYLYGLSSYGQPGVEKVLTMLRSEIQRTMKLIGCTEISQLNREYLRAASNCSPGLI